MSLVRLDIEACKDENELPTENIPVLMQYLNGTINQAKAYVQVRESTGIRKHLMFGEFVAYDSIRDCVQCLIGREDITTSQKTELESIADFWAGKEEILKEGFYDGRPNPTNE
jgi:hypothetical protein